MLNLVSWKTVKASPIYQNLPEDRKIQEKGWFIIYTTVGVMLILQYGMLIALMIEFFLRAKIFSGWFIINYTFATLMMPLVVILVTNIRFKFPDVSLLEFACSLSGGARREVFYRMSVEEIRNKCVQVLTSGIVQDILNSEYRLASVRSFARRQRLERKIDYKRLRLKMRFDRLKVAKIFPEYWGYEHLFPNKNFF